MRAWHGVFVLVMAAGLVGCAHRGRRLAALVTNSEPLEALLAPTRTHPLPLSGYYDRLVGTPDEVEEQLKPSQRPPAEYRELSPEQCQCLAIKASTEGNRLAAERQALTATAARHLNGQERLKIQVLWAAELEARNRSASAALKVYYQIAQAEANRPIVEKSLEELDDALGKVARLRENGMQVPFNDGELKRDRLAVFDQRLKLTGELDHLNAQLIQLLGLSATEARPRIWPATDFTVNVQSTDMDMAVAVGMTTRPELQLLASLRSSLSATNVGIARGVLSGPTSAAAMPISRLCKLICGHSSNRRELPTRERQLAQHYDERRREVTAEIQQAVLEVESRLRRIAVEKQVVNQWHTEIDNLTKKKQIDEATFVDVSRARLKRLQAESDEIEQIIAWKIAGVKVKEAQGMLVTECQGKSCRFLDFPVVQENGAAPSPEAITPDRVTPEFITPLDILPNGIQEKSGGHGEDGEVDDKPTLHAPRLPPPLTLPSVGTKSIVTRAPTIPGTDIDTTPPDFAAEPGE